MTLFELNIFLYYLNWVGPRSSIPVPLPNSFLTIHVQEDEQEAPVVDYTKIPTELEAKFDALDEDGTLRPTIINLGETWTKRYQKGLLSEVETTTLSTDEQEKERNKVRSVP